LGFAGPNADAILRAQLGVAPEANDGCINKNGVTVLRLPSTVPRFQVIADCLNAEKLWRDTADSVTPVGVSPWSWLDIIAGVPTIYPSTCEAFLPQTVNLDLLGGVSFEKGCYSGQEIIARLHYLGGPKQRMYRAHVRAAQTPAPGDPIYAPDPRDRSVGTVVDARPSTEQGHDILAAINVVDVAAGSLSLRSRGESALTIMPLPYTLA
ncbi:MAG: YgfZ/GcvT domain-containing protein, partial [Acidiferrobacterales bacterium]